MRARAKKAAGQREGAGEEGPREAKDKGVSAPYQRILSRRQSPTNQLPYTLIRSRYGSDRSI